MIFFKIALLNIRKHWKRSLLIVASIAVSVIVLEFAAGFMMGMKQNFFTSILSGSGHIQIYAAGYKDMLDPLSLEKTVKNPQALKKIILGYPGVVQAERIISFGALVIYEDNNLAMIGKGIEDNPQFLSQVKDNIVQGTFELGEFGILVSARVLALLGANFGEYVNVLVENSEGIPTYLDFKITGIFDSGSKDFDDNMVFIRHQDAAELLLLPDQTTEIRISLKDRELASSFKAEIAPMLAGSQVMVETWQEIHGTLIVMIGFFDVFMVILDIILFVVVATLITNAILMNIFERMQEYGTLRAIGMKKKELFSLIMTEASLLGLTGSLLGIAVGVPMVLVLQQVGIPLGEMVEAFNLGKGNMLYPFYAPQNTAVNIIFGVAMACAASAYAAFVSMKMKIVDSLNYV